MEIDVIHNQILFKTTVFNDDTYGFTNIGIHIKNGILELAYVDRFSRKNWKSKNYQCEEIYHSTRQQNVPSSAIVPDEVWSDAKAFFKGILINEIGK